MAQIVERTIEALKFIADAPRTLTEIAERLEVHKSTALRLAQALEQSGFARRVSGGKYTIGFTLLELGRSAHDRVDLVAAAKPHIREVSNRLGHTIHLAELVDSRIIYMDKVEGVYAMRSASVIGGQVNLHTAAVAKAIVAFLPAPTREEILDGYTFERFTDTTITSREEFDRELGQVRERGFAEDNGEAESFLGCVAAPIRDLTGNVIAGVSITALKSLVSRETLLDIAPQIVALASKVSASLGFENKKDTL